MTPLHWELHQLETVDSTQRWIAERVNELPAGFCLRAERQTAGVGREQRAWSSDSGGLYLSFLLKPEVLLPLLPWGLWWSLLEAVETLCGVTLTLKAPNDLLFSGRKLAGMLIDARICASRPEYYICGVGLNVNQTVFAPELADQAISLRQATGQFWAQDRVQKAILTRFQRHYPLIVAQTLQQPLLDALAGRSVQIGYNRPHSFLPFEEYWYERHGLGKSPDAAAE